MVAQNDLAADLYSTLEKRFLAHMERHPDLAWETVREVLESNPAFFAAVVAMEETGGEPDVVTGITDGPAFIDCSEKTPIGRRNLCYDADARLGRKKFPPASSALEVAAEMGLELLDEQQYYALQERVVVDTKTSSWVLTPAELRNRGGALFCDRRYDRVFTYHNGADSYYSSRAFRGYVLFPKV